MAPIKTGTTTTATAEQIAVPETLLKKRRVNEKTREEKLAKAAEAKKASKASRQLIFKRADSYVKEYLNAEKEEVRLKREARKSGDFYVEAQDKLVFVIRIKGISKIAPKPRKIMQLLRLLQINNGVFVRLTRATGQMLRLIEPYIAYGRPSVSTVRNLIYKRGYAKIDGQRVPITNNQMIEAKLGEKGILCIEDLVHEIATVGPAFREASRFLWAFKLSNPNGGWSYKKVIAFTQGGDSGDRSTFINKLVGQML